MDSIPQPILRKRTHSPRWFVFVPGTHEKRSVWIPTYTADDAKAQRVLESVIRVGLIDSMPAVSRRIRDDALTDLYNRKIQRGRVVPVYRMIDEYLANLVLRGQAPTTIASTTRQLDLWVRSAGVVRSKLSSITAHQVAPWINTPDMKVGYSTRVNRLKCMRGFFAYCIAENRMPLDPSRDIVVRTIGLPQEKLIAKKRVPFTDDEVARLLSGIPRTDWWHGAVLIGKHFGLRLITVAGLEWSALPDLKRITIFTHKGRVVVDEPLPPEVIAWFTAWPRQGDSGYCFPAAAAHVMDISCARLSGEFTKRCRELGIVGRSFHCLRVRAVTNAIQETLAQLGGAERAAMAALLVKHGVAGVQRIVGHVGGSAVTVSRYFNPQPQPA